MTDSQKAKPRRKIQFGIRSLLVLMLVFGVGVGWYVSHVRDVARENKIVETLGEQGLGVRTFSRKHYPIEKLFGRRLYPEHYSIDCTSVDVELLAQAKNLKNVWSLQIASLNGNDLSAVQGFENLQSITVSECRNLESLDGINGLQKLERLWLFDVGQLKDISAMEGMKSLENFCALKGNCSCSLKPLLGVPKLKSFNVNGNRKLGDLDVLLELPELESVTLFGSDLHSLRILEKSEELRELDISTCRQLEDFEALGKLAKLRELSLQGKYIGALPNSENLKELFQLTLFDCDSLKGSSACANHIIILNGHLKTLEGIESFKNAGTIEFTQMRFEDLSDLKILKDVEEINLRYCLLGNLAIEANNPQIEKLRSELPNTNLIVGPRALPGIFPPDEE